MRVAYIFSGVKRKASTAQELKKLCKEEGIGLSVKEIDILIDGSEHDLLDKAAQESFLAEIGSGDFDVIILSPPCGSWSRANFSSNPGPKPVRNRQHPWGLPNMRANDQRWAETGH